VFAIPYSIFHSNGHYIQDKNVRCVPENLSSYVFGNPLKKMKIPIQLNYCKHFCLVKSERHGTKEFLHTTQKIVCYRHEILT